MNNSVTIGITCYNAADTIGRALDSALRQTYGNISVLVVDDASADGSWDVICDYIERFPNKITGLRNEKNVGVAATRNKIIVTAQSDFLVFFDDDDISAPERVERQIERITSYEKDFANGAPVLCHCARAQIYPDGRRHLEGTVGTKPGPAPQGIDMAAHILYNKFVPDGIGSLPTCVQAARTSTYKSLGGFDESFRRSEDTEFNIRFALAGGHFAGLSAPLVEQVMTLADDKKFAVERHYNKKIYDKHATFLQYAGRGTFDSQWLDLKYDYLERRYASFFRRALILSLRHPLLSAQRLYRALPNRRYNENVRELHKS